MYQLVRCHDLPTVFGLRDNLFLDYFLSTSRLVHDSTRRKLDRLIDLFETAYRFPGTRYESLSLRLSDMIT